MPPTTEGDLEPARESPRHSSQVPSAAADLPRRHIANVTPLSDQSSQEPDLRDHLQAALNTIFSSLTDTPNDIAYGKFVAGLMRSAWNTLDPKYAGHSALSTFIHQHWADIVTSSPSQTSTETVAFGKLASLMNFEKLDARSFAASTRGPFRVQPPVHALLNGSMKEVLAAPGSIQWIHLPANNMSWVESLMEALYRDSPRGNFDQISYDQVVLSPQNWTGRQNGYFPHARFMRSSCSKISAAPGDARGSHGLNLAFFMPFLHWETEPARRYIAQLTNDILSERHLSFTDEQLLGLRCNSDERLLRKYLKHPSPLHPRRDLHQAYHAPASITRREESQTSTQHLLENPVNKSRPHVLMVDQCWAWVIGDIVVTCFPGCWVDDPNSEAGDSIDLLEKIVHQLSQREIYETISSSFDLATIIIDSCAGNMMEPNFNQNQDGAEFHFLEVFDSSIRRVMVEQTILFDDFCTSSRRFQTTLEKVIGALRDRERGTPLPEEYEEWEKALSDLQQPAPGDLSDITREIISLRQIKNISDELNMIEDVISQQQRALTMLHNVLGQERWASEKLLRNIRNRKATVEQLHKDASHTYKQIVDLLDLKQKQTNVSEARSSRFQAEQANEQAKQAALQAMETTKQGKSIMLFTTVTILFLPLSTVASLFSLNAKELNGGNLRIGVVFAYLFPISFFIVFFALLLAFHAGLRQLCMLYAQIAMAYLDNATGFSKVVRQDDDEKIEKLKIRLELIRAKSRGGTEEQQEYVFITKKSKWKTFLADRWMFRKIFRRRSRTSSSSDSGSSHSLNDD
ncbi:hypothetical protein BKA64DRAFT_673281 [Cadophora sp. MPI-SDFR-AT-0126]|nr:hypothetical protein BKA64DRAFT_673281 [Leotiomycetes sp. MPI-SDFR-AT-0126]